MTVWGDASLHRGGAPAWVARVLRPAVSDVGAHDADARERVVLHSDDEARRRESMRRRGCL